MLMHPVCVRSLTSANVPCPESSLRPVTRLGPHFGPIIIITPPGPSLSVGLCRLDGRRDLRKVVVGVVFGVGVRTLLSCFLGHVSEAYSLVLPPSLR